MAEEWFQAVFDVLIGRLGVPPMFASPEVLNHSLKTKIGHQRKVCESLQGINFHADHHTYHRKNFGINNAILDMVFGTDSEEAENMYPVYPPAVITKTEQDGAMTFHVVALSKEAVSEDIPDNDAHKNKRA